MEHECKENIPEIEIYMSIGGDWILDVKYNFAIIFCPFCGKELKKE